MRKTLLLISITVCLIMLISDSYAWTWYYDFFDNDSRATLVSDIAAGNNRSFSTIRNIGTDNATARAIIWGNDWPEHFHEVVDPDNGVLYSNITAHQINLFGRMAEMEVEGIVVPTSYNYIRIQLGYPF